MKKTLLLTALFAILFTCTFVALPLNFALGEESFGATTLSNDICAFIKDESVLQITDDFVVIGNNSNINEKQFRELALSGTAKVYLHYSTMSNVPLQYDACLIINNLGKSLEYEYSEQISISTNKLLSNIKKFVARYVDEMSVTSYVTTPSAVNSNDIPTTFTSTIIDREYVANFDDAGYITYHIGVTRYIANSQSILYIVTVNNSFVPGIVANQNGDTSYKKFKNLDGYVHMTVEQAYDRNEEYYYGIRYGTVPYKKDYWPINQPVTVTITSSVQKGLTLGFSFENGFSTSGDVNMNVGVNLGSNISYGYSKALTQNDPFFSAQVSAEVLAYSDLIKKYAEQYGIPQFFDVICAVMMAESGGRVPDVMQASECPYNTKYPKKPNGITDPEYSIEVGVHYLADCLQGAGCSSPSQMDELSLALQGYNYGNGYIGWALENYGGYSEANALEFSKLMQQKLGWSSYGNPQYAAAVMKYLVFTTEGIGFHGGIFNMHHRLDRLTQKSYDTYYLC